MFIIGCGKVGFQTARRLLSRAPRIDVCLFDEDKEKCERIAGERLRRLSYAETEPMLICSVPRGIAAADGFVGYRPGRKILLAVLGKTLERLWASRWSRDLIILE